MSLPHHAVRVFKSQGFTSPPPPPLPLLPRRAPATLLPLHQSGPATSLSLCLPPSPTAPSTPMFRTCTYPPDPVPPSPPPCPCTSRFPLLPRCLPPVPAPPVLIPSLSLYPPNPPPSSQVPGVCVEGLDLREAALHGGFIAGPQAVQGGMLVYIPCTEGRETGTCLHTRPVQEEKCGSMVLRLHFGRTGDRACMS